METIIDEIGKYLSLLNWVYIFTFMIIAWMFSRDNALESVWKEDKTGNVKYAGLRNIFLWFPKGVRIAVLGIVYGIAHYFILSHEPGDIGKLFISFIFAVAFHGLLIKGIMKKLGQ